MKKINLVLIFLSCIFLLSSCYGDSYSSISHESSEETTTSEPVINELVIEGTDSLKKGTSTTFVAKCNGVIVSNVVWLSNDTNIATIDTSGLCSGIEIGSTKISAHKTGYKEAYLNLNVTSNIQNVQLNFEISFKETSFIKEKKEGWAFWLTSVKFSQPQKLIQSTSTPKIFSFVFANVQLGETVSFDIFYDLDDISLFSRKFNFFENNDPTYASFIVTENQELIQLNISFVIPKYIEEFTISINNVYANNLSLRKSVYLWFYSTESLVQKFEYDNNTGKYSTVLTYFPLNNGYIDFDLYLGSSTSINKNFKSIDGEYSFAHYSIDPRTSSSINLINAEFESQPHYGDYSIAINVSYINKPEEAFDLFMDFDSYNKIKCSFLTDHYFITFNNIDSEDHFFYFYYEINNVRKEIKAYGNQDFLFNPIELNTTKKIEVDFSTSIGKYI